MATVHHLTPARALADVAYDPKYRWAVTAQPYTNLSVQEYNALATQAAGDLRDQMRSFCKERGYSFIEIPATAYTQYEKSDLPFREWLPKYCKQHGLDPRADVCIVGPNIKTLESGNRKAGDAPDRVTDYLRGMFVVLKQTDSPQNRTSLQTLDRLVSDLEGDERSLARKNYLYDPHSKTGFRGAKVLWKAVVPEGQEYSGFDLVCEIKGEHASLMDLDKMTRKFIDISRSIDRLRNLFSLGISDSKSARRMAKQDWQSVETRKAMDDLSIAYYDFVCHHAGLNRHLNPAKIEKHKPLSLEELIKLTKETIEEHFPRGKQQELFSLIEKSGILDMGQSRERPAHLRLTRAPN